VFPDFTRAATRQWWGGLYADFIADGFSGFWNDMNEPAVFETPTKTMPLDNLHRIESDDFATRDATHSEIHNVYGMQNTRGTFEGMEHLRPGVRPFVMTRASYAGGQRYAVTWTGDNSSTWDHLRLCVEQLTNLGLSGFAYSGCDVGGFVGGASPDLLTRWYEIAAFTPVFRNHSAHDAPRAEPWVDGPEHLAIRRRFIEERYRLMPYLYAVAEQNARTGDPVMRPVFYDYPDALTASCDQALSFTVGQSLLVAAPPRPESPQPFDICLPKGGWYDYWTGLPVTQSKLTQLPKLDSLPLFVRAGTILPREPLVQSTAQRPSGPLELDIYPGEDCRGELYFDNGVSVNGASLRQELRCAVTPKGLALRFGARRGSYRPWWSEIAITVHGARPARLTIADQPRPTEIVVAPTLSH
jgi:alpha-glucosidase